MDTWLVVNLVCGALTVVLGGLLVWNGRLLRQVKRTQREIEARQKVTTELLEKSGAAHQLVGAHSWRDLDPRSRAMFRQALVQVVAEIDGAPPPTRH